jgi:hypothetical protein
MAEDLQQRGNDLSLMKNFNKIGLHSSGVSLASRTKAHVSFGLTPLITALGGLNVRSAAQGESFSSREN